MSWMAATQMLDYPSGCVLEDGTATDEELVMTDLQHHETA